MVVVIQVARIQSSFIIFLFAIFISWVSAHAECRPGSRGCSVSPTRCSSRWMCTTPTTRGLRTNSCSVRRVTRCPADGLCKGGRCLRRGCGNGILEKFEQCDDANIKNGDGCTEHCRFETCSDGVLGIGEACVDIGAVCGNFEAKESNCNDGLDNDCDGYIDQKDPGCPAANIVAWHHSFSEDSGNIPELAASGLITHLIIGNLDFNEQPVSSVVHKIALARQHGLIVIWERDLWFQDGAAIQLPEAQHFKIGYQNGTIIFNSNYYAWYLKKLRDEATALGVELVAADLEPHMTTGNMRTILKGPEDLAVRQNWFNFLRTVMNNALAQSQVQRADYVSPTDTFIREFNGYRALSEIGRNKIGLNTYFDCNARLDWGKNQDFDMIGAWVTSNSECYRAGTSCNLDNYGKSCPWTSPNSNTALWGPYTIFNNSQFWRSIGRGIFLYAEQTAADPDDEQFPRLLLKLCNTHPTLCQQ